MLDVDGSPSRANFGHLGGEGIVDEEVQCGARKTVLRRVPQFRRPGLRCLGEFTSVQGHLGVGGLDERMDAGNPVGDVAEVRRRGDRFVKTPGGGWRPRVCSCSA